jgi:5'-phosphate synthase pdxT subunit
VEINFPSESQNHVPSRVIAFQQSNLELANSHTMTITVGVLALQGAFYEHIQLLKKAADQAPPSEWQFIEVRTPQELSTCDGLVLPGGESTTMSLVAARSNLLEPLRDFVK